MKTLFGLLSFFLLMNCSKKNDSVIITKKVPKIVKEFGYTLNDYMVIKDTIKSGENFSEILTKNNISWDKITDIVQNIKGAFDLRTLRAGKPYTILASNDSLQQPKAFIYQQNKVDYFVVDFHDTIQAHYGKKNVKTVTKIAKGIISSSLSQAIEEQGLDYTLAHELGDIYAWSIDFFHLHKGDRFKIIYEQRYIDDTISAGIGKLKAAYFEHKDNPFYAFRYVTDSANGKYNYYDDSAKVMRRQFLKAPLKYGRISSRYNKRRRIKLYGNKIRPHLGTDFAAPYGTPIISTANGTVIEAKYRGGNGNYVKVKHNGTYTTQYLHMKKRKVKKGQFVNQGDVIGWVGMTGNTSGPHVCYRFWKNGKQVDPFRQKLPEPKPIKDSLKPDYLEFIKPLKTQIDSITFSEELISNSI